jgi:serine protease Do
MTTRRCGHLPSSRPLRHAALLAAALVAASCGGSTAPTTAESTTTTTTTAPPVGTVDDVAPATVKLITEGSPLEPFSTDAEQVGKIGSGFIVHSDGLVVATLHSMAQYDNVTAYLLDSDEPIDATVVGVSECNDLVLLDLAGDGYSALDWRTEPFNPGLKVFAAGYPLNLDTDPLDADYTLTAGIVNTAGRTASDVWVAVDGVIEHDARIRGGSSGGPLVDEQGDVVGVNFAGDDDNDINSAIAASVAADVVDRLMDGDVESIGIDGEAASDDTVGGVWVSGVRPGTPAESAGVQAGDLITSLGGEALGLDPTLQTYCDVLRSAGSADGLDLEVLRTATGEVLTGAFGGEALSVDPTATGDDAADVDAYEFVADDSESIGVEIPASWDERDGSPNQRLGPNLAVSPDLDGFLTTWDVPGLILDLDPDRGIDDLDTALDDLLSDQCTSLGRVDFATDDGAFIGRSETLGECGGTTTQLLNIAATRPDGRSLVLLQIQVVDEADIVIAERAVATFDAALPD